ncbi:MAG: HAMP domain-containing histidine kinase [Acidimicrobiia bacterium]|nr:HAMP domain-containing histidine kinase [Acidimicrobiia bacterium]
MNPRSVRSRITALATVTTALVLLVVGVVVVAVVQARLLANLDASLDQRADQIEALSVAGDPSALANRNAEDRFAQITDAAGAVIGATSNIETAAALVELPPGGSAARSVATRHDLPLEDDDYRVLVRRFEASGTVRYVIVGENVDDLRDAIAALRGVLAVLFPVAVAAIAAMVWWLVGRTLRPVEGIRVEVAAIGLGQLDRRVPQPGSGDEIDRLAATMNDMLGRLEGAVAQQRRFVADASHELRTPLTRLRTLLEVDSSLADVDPAVTAREALCDVTEMQALIDDLLFLARVDAGRARRPPGPVDLDAVVEREVAAARTPGGPTITLAADPVVVTGDDAQVARLVRNLVSNARRHAASQVRVMVRAAPGAALLVVEDDGPGIPAEARGRVFDRFVRLDEARDGSGGGSGLGLAIARDITELHGGSIGVEAGALGGARFTVRFPPDASG